MFNRLLAVGFTLMIAITGCTGMRSTATVANSNPATQPAEAAPSKRIVIHTSLAPRDAVVAAASGIHEHFDLTIGHASEKKWDFPDILSAVYCDYFTAETDVGLSNNAFSIHARWLKLGLSELAFDSDLYDEARDAMIETAKASIHNAEHSALTPQANEAAAPAPTAYDQNSPAETFSTTLAPIPAVDSAIKAIWERFQLPVGFGGTYSGYGSDTISQVSGDYFSAESGATANGGGTVDIDAHWERDGQTRVELRSERLEPSVNHAIREEIHRAIEAAEKSATTPATQPATAP